MSMRHTAATASSPRRHWTVRSRRRPHSLVFWLLAVALAVPAGLSAQPFGTYTVFSGNGSAGASNGDLEVPDSPALNPAGPITIEGWVSLSTPFGGTSTCRSLIGKNFHQSYWVGVCGSTLRAYLRGDGTFRDAGTVPAGQWTHFAVTYDGANQLHYINGELIHAPFAVTGPPAASTAPVEIGGDFSYPFSPNGAVTEFRLWNVARTVDDIRGTINVPLTHAQPGLVAVWSLGGANDPVGGHNGTFHGTVSALAPPAIISCGSSTTSALCLDSSFFITVSWRTGAPPGTPATSGPGHVVVAGPGSGIFWFFSSDNWELMVKVINGCALNSSFWLFSAATTNVFYRMDVTDVRNGITKVYFNYTGPPAPAVTDTVAFPNSC